MKTETKYVIKNIETGHYYCESKYNFCINKKYAETFNQSDVDVKLKELKDFFNCEKESANENPNNI